MTLQRAAVVLVAVLAAGWLAVSYDNARDLRHAQVVGANADPTPAEIESALDDVRSAGTLDPSRGTEALSYEVSLERVAGRRDVALERLEELVRREPDTAEAWFLIAELTRESDPARSAEALARLHRLDPLGAPPP